MSFDIRENRTTRRRCRWANENAGFAERPKPMSVGRCSPERSRMTVHRREVLYGLGSAAAAVLLDRRAEAAGAQTSQVTRWAFPRKSDFLIDPGYTYLNAAYTHPIPKVAVDAARRAAEGRGTLAPPAGGQSDTPKALFAALINAKPS